MVALQRSAGNAAVNRLLRQLAPPAATSGTATQDPGAAAGPPTRLVADAGSTLVDGQMRVSDFTTQLQASLCSLANSMLADQAQGCPWIAYWISSYSSRDPAEIEQVLVRYAPAAIGADTAAELITAVSDRVRAGITNWQQTGRLDADAAAAAAAAASTLAPGAAARPTTPAVPGSLRCSLTEQSVRERLARSRSGSPQLGPGRPLEPAVASRMGPAVGAGLASVRVHDDPLGAATVTRLGATALAVGSHIAFAPNQYAPGRPSATRCWRTSSPTSSSRVTRAR